MVLPRCSGDRTILAVYSCVRKGLTVCAPEPVCYVYGRHKDEPVNMAPGDYVLQHPPPSLDCLVLDHNASHISADDKPLKAEIAVDLSHRFVFLETS